MMALVVFLAFASLVLAFYAGFVTGVIWSARAVRASLPSTASPGGAGLAAAYELVPEDEL